MHISEIFKKNSPAISFEFFPPKSAEASEKLFNNIQTLLPLKPAYVSVTYGAGGSTRELTHELVIRLHRESGLTIIPHLTCIGASKDEIFQILKKYHDNGIENVMALRGDRPQDSKEFTPHPNGFHYAFELVAFIKKHFPKMGVGVAGFIEGHPECPNRLQEMEYFKQKVDAGADYICTQLFFDNRSFFDFKERCELSGINIPIIAGIMPISSSKGLKRMADLAQGTNFPARLLRSLYRAETDQLVKNVGTHWATEQVRDLLDHNIQGIHFYTLNQASSTINICNSLGISSFTRFQEK